MSLDHLAKQIRRRGVLAALAGVLATPLTGRALAASCTPRGANCTLLVPCCGELTCVPTSLYNPNAGVCQDVDDDDDDDNDDDDDGGGWFSGPDTDDDADDEIRPG